MSTSRFLVTRSIAAPFLHRPACSVEGARAGSGSYVAARAQNGVRADDGPLPTSASTATDFCTTAPAPTTLSTRRAFGPDLDSPRPIDRAALEDRPGEEGHVRRQLHRDVDVGLGRVDHRDARVEPLRVGAPPQLGLGVGQLGAIVDALRLGGIVGPTAPT